jgi:hypothetical protein
MKITKTVISDFEADQVAYGTGVALFNYTWQLVAKLLGDIGVKKLKTTMRRRSD